MLGPHIGELLREIFRGGPSITLSLKEEHMWKMIRVMFIGGRDNVSMTTAAFLDAFQEILLVYRGSALVTQNQL